MAKRHSSRPRPIADIPVPVPELSGSLEESLVKLLEDMSRESPEQAQALARELLRVADADVGNLLDGGDAPPPAKADKLYFDALNARTPAAARRKLMTALKEDPGHVRTLTALAMMEPTPPQAEDALRKAIAIGEEQLGDLLKDGQGQLWSLLEARPYLEARGRLAQLLLWQKGREEDAIAEHQALLRLNEDDNQGVRHPLLGLLLQLRRFEEARALLKRYDTDSSASWLYGRALLEFEKRAKEARWDTAAKDEKWLERQIAGLNAGVVPNIPARVREADKNLIKALKFNPWAGYYLMRPEEHPLEGPPQFYSPGSEEEAFFLLEYQEGAWEANPAALLWLTLTGTQWLLEEGMVDDEGKICI